MTTKTQWHACWLGLADDVNWNINPHNVAVEPTVGLIVAEHDQHDGAIPRRVSWNGTTWDALEHREVSIPTSMMSDGHCDQMVRVVDGYGPLFEQLVAALNQSQRGKGKERHANDQAFVDQPILSMARMVGVGGPAQQVMKKTQEAVGMSARGQHGAAVAELHGAIVYAAAMAILIGELELNEKWS